MKALFAFAVTALLALSACSGIQTFDQHLRQLEGKPVNDADLLLGHHATGEYQDGNATVYVWQDQMAKSIFGDNVTKRGGYRIGSPYGGINEGGTNDSLIWAGIQFHTCVIRARTVDGIIKKVTFEGNPGGCETIYGARREPIGRDIRS